ncbi:hypothetical protein QUA82_27030 [Microcoleus sp. F8-D3]
MPGRYEMLHHSQSAFYEQAVGQLKRENLLLAERARQPIADNGALWDRI